MLKFVNTRKAVEEVAKVGVKRLKQNLKNNGTNATKKLTKSINFVMKDKKGFPAANIVGESYWESVEKGIEPNSIKRSGNNMFYTRIGQWMKARGIGESQGSIKSAKIRKIFSKSKERAQRQLRFLIIRKIKTKGTDAQPFVQPLLDSNFESMYAEMIAEGLKKDILEQLNKNT